MRNKANTRKKDQFKPQSSFGMILRSISKKNFQLLKIG